MVSDASVHDNQKPRPEEACERHPVTNLALDLLVRQTVQRLQHQHSEQHQRNDRLAPAE